MDLIGDNQLIEALKLKQRLKTFALGVGYTEEQFFHAIRAAVAFSAIRDMNKNGSDIERELSDCTNHIHQIAYILNSKWTENQIRELIKEMNE